VTILDTNAVSEALKPAPSSIVMRWAAAHEASMVFITAITRAEILVGIETMVAGKRKQQLAEVVDKIITHDFRGRILPFDTEAARQFATISAIRKSAGRPISQFRRHDRCNCPRASRYACDAQRQGLRVLRDSSRQPMDGCTLIATKSSVQ
jgi:predicted nucleic acid-binding protein